MLSIVIPFRNETELGPTIDRIRSTCTIPHEVVTVDDGSNVEVSRRPVEQNHRENEPIGNCYCRHVGITMARYPTVLVLDAHMAFWPDDWARALVRWSTENPNNIACTVCPQLGIDRMSMDDAKGNYHGAYLKWTDISFQRRRALPNKWGPFEAPCQVGCVLGGAYVMQRQRYMDIGAPWQYMRGWGHSEQIISLTNYLLGGENWIVPVEIGHMFRTGDFGRVPYTTFAHNLYYNQMVVIGVCVHDDCDKEELQDHIALDMAGGMLPFCRNLIEEHGVNKYANWIRANTVQSWYKYKREWIEPYKEDEQ